MAYRSGSPWNDLYLLECLLILRKLESERFPRGMLSELCRELEKNKGAPKRGSLAMAVSNFEYLVTEGRKGLSAYSSNAKRLYEKYENHSIAQLEEAIARLRLEN